MFLTKKGFLKILIISICYFSLGTISIALSIHFYCMGVTDNNLLIIGIIIYLFCVLIFFCGRYTEGKGKIINLGNKLVRKELKPAEFINHYKILRNKNDLVILKPSIEILQLVAIAYDLLDDRENAMATVDEMINTAEDKRKDFSKLVKVSFLFSYGKIQEAELLFNEIRKHKLNNLCNYLVETILKSDRAWAMGDYKTVEIYNLKMLERSFPKLDNLGTLVVHYKLGEIYELLRDNRKATAYYHYCANFGGDTAIKESAMEKLELLK